MGRILVACVLVATGCRDVLAIDEPLDPCFEDGFDATDIDFNRWAPMDPASLDLLSVEAGGLVISPPPNATGENGIATIDQLDFTDGLVEATVHTQSAPGQLQTFFLVLTAESSGFGLIANEGHLTAREFTNGVNSPDGDTPPFDPSWIYWRIRHHADARTITLEVSADRRSYQTIRTLTDRPAPQIGSPRLQAGIYAASAEPGRAEFDAIDAIGPRCP